MQSMYRNFALIVCKMFHIYTTRKTNSKKFNTIGNSYMCIYNFLAIFFLLRAYLYVYVYMVGNYKFDIYNIKYYIKYL